MVDGLQFHPFCWPLFFFVQPFSVSRTADGAISVYSTPCRQGRGLSVDQKTDNRKLATCQPYARFKQRLLGKSFARSNKSLCPPRRSAHFQEFIGRLSPPVFLLDVRSIFGLLFRTSQPHHDLHQEEGLQQSSNSIDIRHELLFDNLYLGRRPSSNSSTTVWHKALVG